ncbi:leucine-rich repeat-containing protein 74A-like isoform X3 [Perca fluviatilis]|uniref:leucine-rich repeat-containing protein 74A-like isoform X3 n=1 Tax=Perca fluviatilis TaxID=8168 RepID=UPI0019623ED8|nr:leucine-rich repeat-containing protein 74A-like isoform X3 [Perca fluviatilis]
MMDQWEEISEEEEEEEQQLSDQSVLPTGSQDQLEDEEKPTQAQEVNSGDEWDTDLETDNATNEKQCLSCAELYLQACWWTGSVPVSSFRRHLGEASLNLNHYGVGPLGAKALAIVLQNDIVVTNLELEDNGLGAEGARYMVEMLQTNISIQSLNLSNNQLHLEGAHIISKMLLDNYYIKSLKLSATNVGIEVLNLSWNHLRMGGAVALSAGLKVNSTLKQLQLSWNGFGHIEAESLGQALKQNSTLVLLDLSSNSIDDQAATLLCQGLAANDTLRVLKLSHNPLTNIGALTLLKTITNNMKSAVEEIDISTVFVCEAFVELLEKARQGRPALDVRHSAMSSVTRNSSALQIFQKFLEERNESILDFFQALDKEGTTKVSTAAFRKAVKAANIPLDQRQLEWLIRMFDKKCTATIIYRLVCELVYVGSL